MPIPIAALLLAAAPAPATPVAAPVDPGRYVLVAFAGDRQIGFIRPADVRADGTMRQYDTLWIYTPPAAMGAAMVRHAVRTSRADCARGASGELSARFFGAGAAPLFAEPERTPDMAPVVEGTARGDVFRFVCRGEEPYPAFRTSADPADAAKLADEIAGFYRANPTR